MKKILFYALSLATAASLTGCADYFEGNYQTAAPERGQHYEYLNEYGNLNEYVKREAYPNFKLGGATDAAAFNEQQLDYAVSITNFDELVTGNSFKHASIVGDNGSMNFATISDFADLAVENGKTVFGHNLVWHSQQNTKYLKSLIADKKVVIQQAKEDAYDFFHGKMSDGNVVTYTEVLTNGNLEGDDVSCFFTTEPSSGGPHASTIVDGVGVGGSRGIKLVSADGASQDDWATQFFIQIPEAIPVGTPIIVDFDYRANKEAGCDTQAHTTPGNYVHWACVGSPTFTTNWQHLHFEGQTGAEWTDGFRTIAFNLAKNKVATEFYFDNISFQVGTKQKVEFLVENGDMEGDNVANFFTTEPTTGGPHASTIVAGEGVNGSRCVKLVSADGAGQDDWATQFFIRMNRSLPVGTALHVEFDYKSDKEAASDTQSHSEPGSYIHWACVGSPTWTSNWQHFSADITTDGAMTDAFQTIAFNLAKNKVQTTFWIDNIVVYTPKKNDVIKYWAKVVDNDCESNANCLFTTEPTTGGPHASDIYEGVGMDGTKGVKIVSTDNPANDWDTQFFIRMPEALPVGTKFRVNFDYRAIAAFATKPDIEGSFDTQAHSEPGSYIHYMCIGSGTAIPTWQHYSYEGVTDGAMTDAFQTIAFNLAKNKTATEFYFDNILIEIEKEQGNTIPLTPEEKRDTLTFALKTWINGMMDAVGEKVKAWDLVNEPMSDAAPDSLKCANVDGGDGTFYWQDYLGKDYGRLAAQIVRNHPNGKDAKLFINEYNLEWYDKKLDGLINMINYWERDVEGEEPVKIDGIGTQMHVSYSLSQNTQLSNEANYTNMLKKLVATGKLIRISELDMGVNDENGNTMTTEQINALPLVESEKIYHAMADYYQFIVTKYLEMVPKDQQWGICVWGVTDSPKGSGWRAGEPIGLWDENFYRKHAYAGFANGLNGGEVIPAK
ncbi:MAG: endo-1,4-beta-xylanase [Prevotellaceae bacterium]|nr:endo-1,4-beta-xylanase [Prevotellaceae bacterium]